MRRVENQRRSQARLSLRCGCLVAAVQAGAGTLDVGIRCPSHGPIPCCRSSSGPLSKSPILCHVEQTSQTPRRSHVSGCFRLRGCRVGHGALWILGQSVCTTLMVLALPEHSRRLRSCCSRLSGLGGGRVRLLRRRRGPGQGT